MLIGPLDPDGTRVCSSVSSRLGDADNSARSSSVPEEFDEGKSVALVEGSKGDSKSLNSLAALTVKSTAGIGQIRKSRHHEEKANR